MSALKADEAEYKNASRALKSVISTLSTPSQKTGCRSGVDPSFLTPSPTPKNVRFSFTF